MRLPVTVFATILQSCLPEKEGLTCGAGTHEEEGVCVPDEADPDTGDTAERSGGSGGSGGPGGDGDSSDSGGADTGSADSVDVCADGSAPFADLQDAIDAAVDGDVITVCAGTYGGITLRDATLTLEGVEGAELTTIDGDEGTAVTVEGGAVTLRGFRLDSARTTSGVSMLATTDADVSLEDIVIRDRSTFQLLYITRGSLVWDGGEVSGNTLPDSQAMVFDTLDSLDLRHLRVEENYSGSVLFSVYYSETVIENSIFRANEPVTSLMNLWSAGQSIEFRNNVVYGNDVYWGGSPAYLIYVSGSANVYNNIFVGNEIERLFAPDAYASYNGIYDNPIASDYYAETGDVLRDPEFVDPEAGDFRLADGSPCIDAGDPDDELNDTDGTRNDLGAYGGPEGIW